MKLINSIFIALSLLLLVIIDQSFAKTNAYFFGDDGKVGKLDTDSNTVSQLKLKIPDNTEVDEILSADKVNNYIYAAHCTRLEPCKVGVYGLKTLSFIKELPIISSAGEEILMAIYPDGSKFLIQYFIPGNGDKKGGYTTDLYDAKTITLIKNLTTIFNMKRVMFSQDSSKIYSVIDGTYARVETIDSTTFEVLTSKDLTQIWRKKPEVFSSGVKNYGSGKILIFENLQVGKQLPTKLDFYTYNIETQTVSPKISTDLQGDAFLTPDGTKILFDENQDIRDSDGNLRGFKSLGRLHVYDVATAQKLGSITFQPKGQGKIRGIRLAGDRLYYQAEGETEKSSQVFVIDLNNYSVITTLNLPFNVLSVVFFEE